MSNSKWTCSCGARCTPDGVNLESLNLKRAVGLLKKVQSAEGARIAGDLNDGRMIDARTIDDIGDFLHQMKPHL